jgi:hypothetical protein
LDRVAAHKAHRRDEHADRPVEVKRTRIGYGNRTTREAVARAVSGLEGEHAAAEIACEAAAGGFPTVRCGKEAVGVIAVGGGGK